MLILAALLPGANDLLLVTPRLLMPSGDASFHDLRMQTTKKRVTTAKKGTSALPLNVFPVSLSLPFFKGRGGKSQDQIKRYCSEEGPASFLDRRARVRFKRGEGGSSRRLN